MMKREEYMPYFWVTLFVCSALTLSVYLMSIGL